MNKSTIKILRERREFNGHEASPSSWRGKGDQLPSLQGRAEGRLTPRPVDWLRRQGSCLLGAVAGVFTTAVIAGTLPLHIRAAAVHRVLLGLRLKLVRAVVRA